MPLSGPENKKFQFAVPAIGAPRRGIEPGLLDEVVWWQTDDFWWHALAASVAVIGPAQIADGVPTFVARLRTGLTGPSLPAKRTEQIFATRPVCRLSARRCASSVVGWRPIV